MVLITLGSTVRRYLVKLPLGGSQAISTSVVLAAARIPPLGFSGPLGRRVVTIRSPFILLLPMTQAMVITYSVLPPCRSRNHAVYFPVFGSLALGGRVLELLTVSVGKMVTS